MEAFKNSKIDNDAAKALSDALEEATHKRQTYIDILRNAANGFILSVAELRVLEEKNHAVDADRNAIIQYEHQRTTVHKTRA